MRARNLIAAAAALIAAPAFDMQAMDMPMQNMEGQSSLRMQANLGSYAVTREASGTSWQPNSTPHEGLYMQADDWSIMAHGNLSGVFDDQGGPRGDTNLFATGYGMASAQHEAGGNGTVNFRTMLSADPLMGPRGYPLLFATGETADGKTPLVDRQHPHDLVDELSSSYSYRLGAQDSLFIYGGEPGEPALGPTAYMHRTSAGDSPEAPITHHWLDSTHVTFGVVTVGAIHDAWKLEASTFRGREPDPYRYDIEQPKLDSVSTRLSFNPTENLSFQTSWGYLKSPEQLMPATDEDRVTASGTYNLPFDGNNWATTFAWGRKIDQPGHRLDGFLLESALSLEDKHTFFTRFERVDEDELRDGTPFAGVPVTVTKASAGYIRDWRVAQDLKCGLGGLVSQYAYPDSVRTFYGAPPTSFMLFMRLKVSS
jgi:hypothetical protein